METLKERISKEYLEAFKSRDNVKKNLLGVIKSEITTQEKNAVIDNLSDADTIKILNKVAKNLKETIEKANSEEAKLELAIVETYLPALMSDSEIRTALKEILDGSGESTSQIGKLMGAFNAKYAGKADNKTVSTIAKELLTT